METREKTHNNMYKRFNFNYKNINVKTWTKVGFRNDNIKSFVIDILENKTSNKVMNDFRNVITLTENDYFSIDKKNMVVKEFCLSRKYDDLRFRFIDSKAFRSMNIAIKMKQIDINTPEPLIAVDVRGQFNKLEACYFVSEYIDYDYNLLKITSNDKHPLRGRVEDLLPQIGKDIRKLHDNGIIHSDLHPGNILIKNISTTPDFYYIDLNRARQGSKLSMKSRIKDLTRFNITDEETEVLMKSYSPNNYKDCLKAMLKQKEKEVKVREIKRKFRKTIRNYVN